MSAVIEMQVHMDCAGCESKIKKALQKLKGVDDVDIDMDMQKVTVTGWAEQKKVLKTVRKTGRRAELWPFPYNQEYQHNNNNNNNNNNNHQQYYHTFQSQPSSSYNYYKHGYSHDRGYYHHPQHSTIFGDQTGVAFSDDNPHACSIM
ncbi:heavy metal-associated isoprenylated plant protein 28-like [Cornus florida]|uniref:heavy metal-associated isoprenylated plant protein 28-like n=1 Tax=Cornus florida TaxID=4283 RepID=UPI0028A0D693|nr:heavy metal-associated isoprenylated plant protein 28-like [Cornus florida]